MRVILPLLLIAMPLLLVACAERPQATSLLGEPLMPMELDPAEEAKRRAKLDDAEEAYRANPTNVTNIIWLGRRWAYLGAYRKAIEVYTMGLELDPAEYRLLRHRGHRYITVRQLDDAIADLERAAGLIQGVPDEVEADGLPNRLNIPTSTSHTNIYYHLGLARYLEGDFDGAIAAYAMCLEFSKNDDMRVAAAYWLYLSLRRANRDAEAAAVLTPIMPEMDVIENTSYHRLLLLYKGVLSKDELLAGAGAGEEASAAAIDDATLAYGLGAWHLLRGDDAEAVALFTRITNGPAWPAFGHIAAEAELAKR